MSRRLRLIYLGVSLAVLVVVGKVSTGSFDFILTHFWFTSGLFLLLLLSLIDQPHFSTDANVFINGTAGWVSLLLVTMAERDWVWWSFFSWTSYLVLCSFILMWLRTKSLGFEKASIAVLSRVNREVGKPQALFSAFFLWGCVRQFGVTSTQFDALFAFWAIYMIFNVPAIARALDKVVSRNMELLSQNAGVLLHVVSPRMASAQMNPALPESILGRRGKLKTRQGRSAAEFVILDDHVVAGKRIAKLAITRREASWQEVAREEQQPIRLELESVDAQQPPSPVSVVDVGTDIGVLSFCVSPNITLSEGEIVVAQLHDGSKAFYQIVSAKISASELPGGNTAHNVWAKSGQLGTWNEERLRFEPITWVPPAGELLHRAEGPPNDGPHNIPRGHAVVGTVPNSRFPIHVNLSDIVTHNSALVGVTGSGKSYLAFHLIEELVAFGVKVMILDISRQHYAFLHGLDPHPLKQPADVAAWLRGDKQVGVHQYAIDGPGYPQVTGNFVKAAFNELSTFELRPGHDPTARLCVVLEEAHSLIPEWNQVAQQGDVQQVNRTARTILQGRKFGMGCLLITQRTANVTKTILNQCNTIFALQSFDQTGLDFLKNYMGEDYAHAISTLPTQHCILVGKASSSARPVMFRVPDYADRWRREQPEEGEAVPADS